MSRAHARDIGSAFQNREDLRPPICAALIRMCSQNRRILQVQPGSKPITAVLQAAVSMGSPVGQHDRNPLWRWHLPVRQGLRSAVLYTVVSVADRKHVCSIQASGAAQSMGLAQQIASADSDDDEDELAASGTTPADYTVNMAKR